MDKDSCNNGLGAGTHEKNRPAIRRKKNSPPQEDTSFFHKTTPSRPRKTLAGPEPHHNRDIEEKVFTLVADPAHPKVKHKKKQDRNSTPPHSHPPGHHDYETPLPLVPFPQTGTTRGHELGGGLGEKEGNRKRDKNQN